MIVADSTSTQVSDNREPLFDILRGVAVVLMIASHAIFFFHNDTNEILRTVARIGNATVFTMFLFLSGVVSYRAYFKSKSWDQVTRHILKRSFVIYVGYLIIAVIAVASDLKFATFMDQLRHMFLAAIFYDVPSFSEFLIPFLIYPLTFVILPQVYSAILKSKHNWIILALASYIVGTILFIVPVPWYFVPYKALFVGEEGILRFPILQYFPVFSLGLLWSSSLNLDNIKKLVTSVYKSVFITGIVVITSGIFGIWFSLKVIDPMTRWPPSIGFLALGMYVLFVIALIILLAPQNRFTKWIWQVLAYIGADSFDLYLVNIILLFTYKRFWGINYQEPLIVAVLTFMVFLISVLLSSLNWKVSPSLFTVGPVTITNAGRYRIKKRYLTAISILLIIVFTQVSTPSSPVIGSFLEKSDLTKASVVDISLNKRWFVKEPGKSLDPLLITLNEKEKTENITYTYSMPSLSLLGEFSATTSGSFEQTINLTDVPEGEYPLSVSYDNAVPGYPLYETTIFVSQPMYVSWTLDWEGWDVADRALADIETISSAYNSLPITHFFNPRIYLPEIVPKERADYLTTWLIKRVREKNDEVALHLHMQFDMLKTVGIEPKTEPRWNYRSNEGYDVYTTAYTKEELMRLFSWAKDEFTTHGLPKPIGYRAGGWYADGNVLSSLAGSEFLYDASGKEKPLEGPFTNIPWNLTARTLPYFPSIKDQNTTGADHFNILEIPNNGLDTYNYRSEVLLQRYYANYKEGILKEPRIVTFVSHPQWYQEEFPKIKTVLDVIHKQSAVLDRGPVIFVAQEAIYELWKNSTSY